MLVLVRWLFFLVFLNPEALKANVKKGAVLRSDRQIPSLDSSPVCIDDGCLQGKVEPDSKLRPSYEAWYGIPYASPPVGTLRFENPVPPAPWTSVYDATYPRSPCVQIDFLKKEYVGDEDCLYLNVFSPKKRTSTKLLPVLVFIHGGIFKWGSADPLMYGPEYLMETKQVLVVTLQYRLNVFGFLAANHTSCKGNFGLKDQSLALKWVRNNIRHFGGDSRRVTLMGQSAGASSVQYQMMSKRSNGLFQRAVLMSGSALVFWALSRNPETQFRQFATVAGVLNPETESPEEIIRQLREKPAAELMLYHEKMPSPISVVPLFRPVVEADWSGAFITEDPKIIWATGRYEHRPFLTGMTGYEESLFSELYYNQTIANMLVPQTKQIFQALLEYPPTVIDRVMDFYFGGTPTAEDFYNVLRFRDFLIDFPMYRTVEQYLRYGDLGSSPVDLYHFNFTASFSIGYLTSPSDPIGEKGASHIDDLLYLFSFKLFGPQFKRGIPETRMKDIFVELIVDYVRGRWNHPTKTCRRESFKRSFCEYVDIQRDYKVTPNKVKLSISNQFDWQMVRFYKDIERMMDN